MIESLFEADREREVASALADLTFCNPFLTRRVTLERVALGDEFIDYDSVWHERGEGDLNNPNLVALERSAAGLVATLGRRLAQRRRATLEDARVYRDLVLYLVFNHYEAEFLGLVVGAEGGRTRPAFAGWTRFRDELEGALAPLAEATQGANGAAVARLGGQLDPAHLCACFFQVRRAFHHIFLFILGSSQPSARLRSEVWQSVFSHDLHRYVRSLHQRMGDITTLITGPSGTGKEVVARAIALSRYLPFDPSTRRFQDAAERPFLPLNLSALSPTLVESELFGHRRGAFTGAVEDRIGWLESCTESGTVFLDEIGEVSEEIQVKLLRVVESRVFERLGESQPRRFAGKLVAATNRDLVAAMETGDFRPDLYYRLCGDLVRTPSLAERLASDPGELHHLVLFLARRAVGEEEAPALAAEVEEWVAESLGSAYAWPGNVRELDQCVRNVLLRQRYQPRAASVEAGTGKGGAAETLAREVEEGALTLDELAARYAVLVHRRAGSYAAAGRLLGVDRRTVKRWVDEASV